MDQEEHLVIEAEDEATLSPKRPTLAIFPSDEVLQSGRQRVDSTASNADDLDSGFGPSGGGGSQKLNGFDRFSDAWKVVVNYSITPLNKSLIS